MTIKQQHVAPGSVSPFTVLVSSMKPRPQSVCSITFLSLCCVLITASVSYSTFVPGRCACLQTIQGVRGQLKELIVFPKSPSCNNITVIVTLKRNNNRVCLNPEAPMGKQLIRCWRRVQELGHNTKLCLTRRRVRGAQRQRSQQRRRGHNRKVSS